MLGTARRTKLLRVLREIGLAGERPATPEAAREFRGALEELGTTYVKLGQLLSSRPDLMPDVYIEELSHLVDEIPPVPYSAIEPVIRRNVSEDAFVSVDPEPVAAASIAQIHKAEEAYNTELIGRIVGESPYLLVPTVVRELVTEEVLVLQHIEGTKVSPGHGVGPERASVLAREFFRSYVTQVAAEGVYHADPHRGNVLITADGRLALLDFGLLGRLDDDTREGMAQLLLALAQNRGDDVAALIIELSMTTLDSDPPGFVADVHRKLPRYHWRPLSRIRAGDALGDLMRMSVQHGIRLPTSFALVGKTLAQADSIARALDPELDPIALLREDALELMLAEAEKRLSPTELSSYAFTQLGPLARLPRRVGQIADRLQTGTLRVGISPTGLEELEAIMRSAANRIGAALIIAGLLLASAWMARVNDGIAVVGFTVASILGLYMLWKILRTPGSL